MRITKSTRFFLSSLCALTLTTGALFSTSVLAQGEKIDYALAVHELGPQAAQGEPSAQLLLGQMYLNGQGVAKDRVKAVELFERSAAQNNKEAQQTLVRLYSEDKNEVQSVKWLSVLAERKDTAALAALPKATAALNPQDKAEVVRLKNNFVKTHGLQDTQEKEWSQISEAIEPL